MKKVLSLLLVTVLLFTVTASELRAWAMVKTDIIYGDADGNEVVNTDDARLVLMAAAGLKSISDEESFKCADVNSDGKLTIFDARQILRACAGIATIQPQGEFSGFDGGGVFIDPAIAVEYFNIAVNKIKTEKPGFNVSEAVDITGFKIGGIKLSGFTANESAESVSAMIESMLVKESEPEARDPSIKGENCDNAMSVETESYVSKLSADEVLGVRCVEDKENGTLTIEIALPDCDLDSVGQTAIGDVLSAQILQENMDTVVGNVFGASEGGDTTRKTVKNCLLRAVIDTSDGSVIEYKTSYTTETKIAKSTMGLKGGILSAELTDIEYRTAISVIYDITDKDGEV